MSDTVKTETNDTLYLNDIVSSSQNSLGVIIEMPDSDSDEESDDEWLAKENVMVSWYPSGEEEIISQDQLSLKSRILEPGFGVERVGDYRSGMVLDVFANCTIKVVGTPSVRIANVPGTLLTPWNLHYHEPNVVFESWLGYILQLQQTLVVGLKNGARLLMKFENARHMEDSKFSEISPYYSGTWYVGQKLEGKARWFKRSLLLSGTMPVFKSVKQKVKGVVLEAILTGIEVEWLMHGFMNCPKQPNSPPSVITGEEMLKKVRVFDRYQQRFLGVGLPALLKTPPNYDMANLAQDLQKGTLPDMKLEAKAQVPIHQCEPSSEAIYPHDPLLRSVNPVTSSSPRDDVTTNLMYETRITDEKTSAEVAMIVEGLKEPEQDTPAEETDEPSSPGIFDKLTTNESDSDDDIDTEEDTSSEQSDSGLDESLNKETEEVKPPDINQISSSTKPEPPRRLVKRAKTRGTSSSGWLTKISPKGPIEVKGQYLVEIVAATYTGKVLWEDGSIEEVPCTELFQIEHRDDHAHFPGTFVNKKAEKEELAVVYQYNSKDRTCHVHWLNINQNEENVSVYSLEPNERYVFTPMDIIVCLVECSHSSIGQIISVTEDGKLLVWWTDDTISAITPDKIVHLASNSDYDEVSEDDYAEADDDDSSWMTADSDFFSDHEEVVEQNDPEGSSEEYKDAKSENSEFGDQDVGKTSTDKEPIGTQTDETQDATEPTGEGSTPLEMYSTLLMEAMRHGAEDERHDPSEGSPRKKFRLKKSNDDSSPSTVEGAELCSFEDISSTMKEHSRIISDSLKTLQTCPDSHTYIYTPGSDHCSRAFLSAIRKDIKLITSSLPPGIWVRAFEDRVDLLSAMVEGPKDTPYEDVLFCFDIRLPSDYSSSPPILHYVAFCKTKLNPNLYPEGKVCLSLLGTWMGKGTEQWTKSSNLLQLLISIQSLVLNQTPFYNEAGFNKYKDTHGGENNAKLYNEMILFSILDHINLMYRYPNEVFEEEIKSYYALHLPILVQRYQTLIKCSSEATPEDSHPITYPLLPLSKGVIKCLDSRLPDIQVLASKALTIKKSEEPSGRMDSSEDASYTPGPPPFEAVGGGIEVPAESSVQVMEGVKSEE